MDIIIDTNILRSDLKLKDKNFEILIDYLKKTNSRLILPSIVLEEAKGLYKRILSKQIDDIQRNKSKLESTVISQTVIDVAEIDPESEALKYIEFIHTKLGTSAANVIHYKNEYLSELVKRAINRERPLNDNGQQFRDGILWLTVLDYTKSLPDKRVTFISDNPKDFTDKGTDQLAAELENEAKKLGLEVNYFRDLNDFARDHASEIQFVTKEWINESIDSKLVENLFSEFLSNNETHEKGILEHTNLEMNEELSGFINRTDYIVSNLKDFFVYEKSDGSILLNIQFEFETEYEVEIIRSIENNSTKYEYRYVIDPITGEPDLDMELVPEYDLDHDYDYRFEYVLFRGEFVLSIKDEKVTNYEFKDWDWG